MICSLSSVSEFVATLIYKIKVIYDRLFINLVITRNILTKDIRRSERRHVKYEYNVRNSKNTRKKLMGFSRLLSILCYVFGQLSSVNNFNRESLRVRG